VLKDLKTEEVEFLSVGKFLLELKQKFSRGDIELLKVAELKKVKQEGRTMEEFIQEFRRAA